MKRLTLLVIFIAFLCVPFADPGCDSNDGKPCSKCPCKGDKHAMRKDGEPDNPMNDKYPRHVCHTACTPKCCFCKRDAVSQLHHKWHHFWGDHEATETPDKKMPMQCCGGGE